VIDAEKTGASEMMTNAGNPVAVALLTTPLGVEGMESPILPTGENRIRWGTDVDIFYEALTFSPHVEAVRVNTQRKIQVQTGSCSTRSLR
jgi:hypothetical protein